MNNNKQNYIIPNSFKYPLFNEAMEKELLKIIEWLRNKEISTTELNLTEHIITELISENRILNKEVNFDTLYNSLNYTTDDDLLKLNSDIKAIEFELSVIQSFVSDENSSILLMLHRFYFKLNIAKHNNCYYILHKLFHRMYAAYIYCKSDTFDNCH
ncbi:MAG: hypothetical protein IJA12_02375 [Oscillospiraceae bacterium]|nr:hypothetical protein [Oscillospiraceae bacterium]